MITRTNKILTTFYDHSQLLS